MNIRLFNITLLLALSLVLTSCFKDEPRNAEADILRVSINLSPEDEAKVFYNHQETQKKVLSTYDKVVFTSRKGADLTAIAPTLEITEGATVTPASGTVLDFSEGKEHTFVVTSEDGKWQRTYTICFEEEINPRYFSSDEYSLKVNSKGRGYYIWDGLCSANEGFKKSNVLMMPDDYTTKYDPDGYKGGCILLRTLSTGAWGQTMKMPLAAGNLYLGEFDSDKALTQTLKSTLFGVPVTKKPVRFSLYYRYIPTTYVSEGKDVLDGCAMYCVLYRNQDSEGNKIVLTGEDITTSPYIVAMAREMEIPQSTEWKKYEVDFKYNASIDPEILANRGYNLALVCSSSKLGDIFVGGIGSSLWVDEIEIEYAE